MQNTIKLGFTKSKAYGLCGVILMTALFTTAIASADEVTPASTEPTSELVTATEPATTDAEASATPEAVTDVTTAPTTVTKEGTTINVENPNVALEFPTGTDKYHGFKVEYKDVKIPDSIEINEGDSVTFTLPKEVSFQTNFDFDVTNSDNDVIGHATTSIEEGTIKTIFNDYFKSHPLNKQMSLTFDAKWTDAVQPGQKVSLNFNGSIQTAQIAERDVIPGDQLVAKWGSQSENDPTTINWVVRLNYARKTLENLIVNDTWSSNQTFVEGSQKLYTVENMEEWTGIEDAKSYLESWNTRADGFDAKFKTFNKLLYIEYQTKLKASVKESFNPTNKVTLDGVASPQQSNAIINLVGGRGNAEGENIPETPEPNNEKPKEDPKENPKEEPKENPKEEPKETPKTEEPKKENPKEPKKDEPKKDEPKKDEPKKDEPKTPNTNNPGRQTQQLPKTGTNTSILSVIGLITGLIVSAIYKKKKNY